ncbi:MAG: peptide deformylase [bacterium]|nr:peptide deformylase [bacterium]
MTTLKLVTQPNKILRTVSIDIARETFSEYKKLGEEMVEAMLKYEGIGLAAPQIGRNINMFTINKDVTLGEDHLILCNPKIVFLSKGTNVMEEGCLSCPKIYGDVSRSEKIRVKAFSLDGVLHTFKAKGLLAKVFQHEIDHLNGTLILDKFE